MIIIVSKKVFARLFCHIRQKSLAGRRGVYRNNFYNEGSKSSISFRRTKEMGTKQTRAERP